MHPMQLTKVPVLVPLNRVHELYVLAASWIQAETAGDVEPPADHAWRVVDGKIAYDVLLAANGRARAIYRVLAQKAGTPVTSVELDEAAGMEGLRRAGVLGSMGRTCNARGRVIPWTWDSERQTYCMPKELGPMFLSALERVEHFEQFREQLDSDSELASEFRERMAKKNHSTS